MAFDFDERISEQSIRTIVSGAKGLANQLKNSLATALAFADGISQDDKTRLQLTDAQWAQLVDFKTKAQDLKAHIEGLGF